MNHQVQITFDCLPLRSIARLDLPLDATPELEARFHRLRKAIDKYGLHNTYYLHNASCVFHLTNDPDVGMLEFGFEGTVLTDQDDQKTVSCDLSVQLRHETCEWLTEPVVVWFQQTVSRAVRVEFDRYIAAGDLEQTIRRIEQMQAESNAKGGFIGLGI